ncbi:MAG TPA: DUF3375 domain-containing protein [Candidatus Obscuribacterales bacterium]
MRSAAHAAVYDRLRKQPLWKLLAAGDAHVIIGLLQAHLFNTERRLPASVFYERLERDLEELRAQGADMPQTARAYAAAWLASGWLERTLPPGATEEQYELSAAAESAIRFVSGMQQRRTTATESRLAVVIEQLVKLAEETDANRETRLAALLEEKRRIEAEIERISKAETVPTLDESQALERAREIISLADELIGDFRRVRTEFEQLNRDLRSRIMSEEESRGAVLEALFADVDLISESNAGRTFNAFWRLLTDPVQSAGLDDALEQVLTRDFSRKLDQQERQFLRRVTGILLDQGGEVHDVMQSFARSLKHFVQSREFLEQRRLARLLVDAQRAAQAVKDSVKPYEGLPYELTLTSSSIRSLSQWQLYDPTLNRIDGSVRRADDLDIDLEEVGELVAQSEIDFTTLKRNIRAVLENLSQTSIAGVMQQYPAEQGLGSVVGYIALGTRHGEVTTLEEEVAWQGTDDKQRHARIPAIYFTRERVHELV